VDSKPLNPRASFSDAERRQIAHQLL